MAIADLPESVSVAVASDDRHRSLVALRDTLARAIDTCESMRDLAALSRQLTEVLEQIEGVPDKAEVSAADEVAKRRTARRAGSPGSARAKNAG